MAAEDTVNSVKEHHDRDRPGGARDYPNPDDIWEEVLGITGEPRDHRCSKAAAVLMSALFIGPIASVISDYIGVDEDEVQEYLFRAGLWDLLSGTRWHEKDTGGLDLICCAMVACGDLMVWKRKEDGERMWRQPTDGRERVQKEAAIIQDRMDISRKEAWKVWKTRKILVHEISIDASRESPFEGNDAEDKETVDAGHVETTGQSDKREAESEETVQESGGDEEIREGQAEDSGGFAAERGSGQL
jgi:hypothetical protein